MVDGSVRNESDGGYSHRGRALIPAALSSYSRPINPTTKTASDHGIRSSKHFQHAGILGP